MNLPGWLTMTNEGMALVAASVVLLAVSIPLGRRRAQPK
jgi:hypothetical protein